MNKDSIVQFVCFTSPLEPGMFIEMWEPFARLLVNDRDNILLHEEGTGQNRNKYSYISQHTCKVSDFSFAFLKGKSKNYFPEHKARVKQAGGYLPIQLRPTANKSKGEVCVMAFVAHGENKLDFYRGLLFRHLNIYEAYFENCIYSYVMEFFLHKEQAPALLEQLRTRPGVEAALYEQCFSLLASSRPIRVSQ